MGVVVLRPTALIALVAGLSACAPCARSPGCLLAEELSAGLLCAQAPGPDDVWITGASPSPGDGTGPMLLHYDGTAWERLDTSAFAGAELWWAWVTEAEAVFVGTEGLVLELDRSSGALTVAQGPPATTTFFGVWGASPDEVWAVGHDEDGDGAPALWRRSGGSWAPLDPAARPASAPGDTYFKVHGRDADDAWIVGTRGTALHWDGERWTPTPTDADVDTSTAPLLTVSAAVAPPIAVGGVGNGLVLEHDGTAWRDVSPAFQPGFNGVCGRDGAAWAVGMQGARAERVDGAWIADTTRGIEPPTREDWHGCALDADGGLWTVGGRIAARPLTLGVVAYQGPDPPPEIHP